MWRSLPQLGLAYDLEGIGAAARHEKRKRLLGPTSAGTFRFEHALCVQSER